MTFSATENAIHFVLSAGETDADLFSRLRRHMRGSENAAVIVITGDLSGLGSNSVSMGDWVGLLSNTALPIVTIASGPIGQRGAAILMLSDQILLGVDASLEDRWRDGPGLAALAHRQLGPLAARSLLIGFRTDCLDMLESAGIAHRTGAVEGMLGTILSSLSEGASGLGTKRALKAAAELTFMEALSFDLWLHRQKGEQHP